LMATEMGCVGLSFVNPPFLIPCGASIRVVEFGTEFLLLLTKNHECKEKVRGPT
jgi:hypothetical protein